MQEEQLPSLPIVEPTSQAVSALQSESDDTNNNNALTQPTGFTLNKDVMRCARVDHDMARLKFLCTDASCKCSTKLACAECILNEHKDHKYVVLEKFVENVSDKFQRISKQAQNLEQANRMDEFQTAIEEEVRAEFEEIKQLVIKSFEEFEKDYLAQIARFFETNKPKMEYKDRFQSIVQLANQKFENLDQEGITKVVEFYADDRLEKLIDDSDKSLIKTKQAIVKKKTKYFETFRLIVKDILLDCKATPTKEGASAAAGIQAMSSLLSPMNNHLVDDKKKKKITFHEDNQTTTNESSATGAATTTTATAANQSPAQNAPQSSSAMKQQNISELQSFSTRSFASETRRFTSSVYKKLKTDANNNTTPHQQAISTQ